MSVCNQRENSTDKKIMIQMDFENTKRMMLQDITGQDEDVYVTIIDNKEQSEPEMVFLPDVHKIRHIIDNHMNNLNNKVDTSIDSIYENSIWNIIKKSFERCLHTTKRYVV